jgi:hypothetical protein
MAGLLKLPARPIAPSPWPWLHWRFADKPSLNKENPLKSEPKISGKLRARLCFTYKKEIG